MNIGKYLARLTLVPLLAFVCNPLTLSLPASLAIPLLLPTVATAQDAAADPSAMMQQAATLEASKQWQSAANMYGLAAQGYAAAGQSAKQATALEKSAAMYEKYANALLKNLPNTAPAASAGPPVPGLKQTFPDQVTKSPSAPQVSAPLPLGRSAIVHANKYGALTVVSASGRPIDGVKISKNDTNIQSPSSWSRQME